MSAKTANDRQIADAMLQRRQHQSFIENGPLAPQDTRQLIFLSRQRVDFVPLGEPNNPAPGRGYTRRAITS